MTIEKPKATPKINEIIDKLNIAMKEVEVNENSIFMYSRGLINLTSKLFVDNPKRTGIIFPWENKTIDGLTRFYICATNSSTHVELEDNFTVYEVINFMSKYWEIIYYEIDEINTLNFPTYKDLNISLKEIYRKESYDALILSGELYDSFIGMRYYKISYAKKGYEQKKVKRLYTNNNVILAKHETYNINYSECNIYADGENTKLTINLLNYFSHINKYDSIYMPIELNEIRNEIVKKYNVNAFQYLIQIQWKIKLNFPVTQNEIEKLNMFTSFISGSTEKNAINYFQMLKTPHKQKVDIFVLDKFSPMVYEFYTKNPKAGSFSIFEKDIMKEILLNENIFNENKIWGRDNAELDIKLETLNSHIIKVDFDETNLLDKFPNNEKFNEGYFESKAKIFLADDNEKYLTNWRYWEIIELVKKCKNLNVLESVDIIEEDVDIWKDSKEEYVKDDLKNMKRLLMNKISFLTGEAGTGKTRLAANYIDYYLKKNPENFVEYVAPTHKAKSMINETIKNYNGDNSELLERTCKKTVKKFTDSNIFNTENKLLIVDEISMININDWKFILSEIEKYDRVLFIGDHSQLPPINPPEITEMILSFIKEEQKTHLNKNRRQRNHSLLNNIIKPIKENKTVTDVNCIKTYSNIKEYKEILESCKSNSKLKILAHANSGIFGVDALNAMTTKINIEEIEKFEIDMESELTVLKNDDTEFNDEVYTNNTFNIIDINTETKPVKYVTDIKSRVVGVEKLLSGPWGRNENGNYYFIAENIDRDDPEIAPAKAITIHKSQGSSIDEIVIILEPGFNENIKLLYTAVSRAMNKIKIVIHKNDLHKIFVSEY